MIVQVSIRELVEDWHLETPEIQRMLDIRRVRDIAHFQRELIAKTGTMWFPGCLTVVEGHPRLLIDGQHRFAAIRLLRDVQPDFLVAVDLLDDMRVIRLLGVDGIFRAINKSVPVPEYVIDTIGQSQRRRLMDAVLLRLRVHFGAFDSRSLRPRAPNIKLEALAEAVCDPKLLAGLQDSQERVVDCVLWINEHLLRSTPADHPRMISMRTKALKHGCRECALGMHTGYADPDVWERWCYDHYLVRGTRQQPPTATASWLKA
jgi:hypothetical protein